MSGQRKRRTSLERQDRVVEALWSFASRVADEARRNPQLLSQDANGATYSSQEFGKSVHAALTEICDTYGYDVQEVQ